MRVASCLFALALIACGQKAGTSPDGSGGSAGSGGGGGLPGAGQDAGVVDAAPPPSSGNDGAPTSGNDAAPPTGDLANGGPMPSSVRVVAYLPNYSGSYADWANRIDFNKMTHLNLAFATANNNNDWNMGAADQDVKALVDAAHAAGVKVLASLGGGGGDQSVIAQYKDPNNIDPLVANLDNFVAAHNFDGVDVDIEDAGNLGMNYSLFVAKLVSTFRPKGKLITAAVAQYLQDSMADTTLHQFDFVNIMIYTNYTDSVNELKYYNETKNVPKIQLTLGAAFFGTDNSGKEYAYTDIMNADGSAWSKDQTTVNGQTVNYTGVDSMKKLADYSKGFGGIMFWELSEDTTDAHSLYKAIQATM